MSVGTTCAEVSAGPGAASGSFCGVFFDLYGTLTAGDRAAVHQACAAVIADAGLSIPEPTFAERWGVKFFQWVDGSNHDRFRTLLECERLSLVETVADFGVQIDPTPYVEMLEAYWRAPPLHPEVLEVVAQLTLPVCIVSNADHAAALDALAHNGLQFAHVVTSEEARSYKPDAQIFEFALRRTGWDARRVLHVGDSLHSDIGGARAAGLRTGWICRDDRIHDIGTVEPDHTFRNLNELLQLLAG